MKEIIRKRGMGKTTELIKISARTDAYIVCRSVKDAERIAEMARKIDLKIPWPVTYEEVLDSKFRLRGSIVKQFLLDEGLDFIAYAFGREGFELKAVTITDESEVPEKIGIFTHCIFCKVSFDKHDVDECLKAQNLIVRRKYAKECFGFESDPSDSYEIFSDKFSKYVYGSHNKPVPTQEEKIKPCPFCGSKDLKFGEDGTMLQSNVSWIECGNCRLRVYGNDSLLVIQEKYKGDEAAALIDKWNNRKHKLSELTTTIKVDTTELVYELKKMQEKLKAQTPHKCPVCDGTGEKILGIGIRDGVHYKDILKCDACEKGILWR